MDVSFRRRATAIWWGICVEAYLQGNGAPSAAQDQATAITISSTLDFLGDKAGARATLLKYLETHPV